MQFRIPVFLALLLLPAQALAVPNQVAHQGHLSDSDGPLTEQLEMVFRLYDSETGGSAVWTETRTLDVVEGHYNVLIGPSDDDGTVLSDVLLQEPALFLEVTAGTAGPLLPRQAIASVPYAVVAGRAESVSGGVVDASEILVNGSSVIDSTGTWTGTLGSLSWNSLEDVPPGIADGDSDLLGGLSCAHGDRAVFDSASNEWVCGVATVELDRIETIGASAGDVLAWDGGSVGWASAGGAGASALTSTGTLMPGATLSVTTGSTDAAVIAQSWVEDGNGTWTPVANWERGAPSAGCSECGDGSDGLLSTLGNGVLMGGYQFSGFDLSSLNTLTVDGSDPIVIRSTAPLTIAGTIDLDGEDASGSTAGSGKAGGYSGTAGLSGPSTLLLVAQNQHGPVVVTKCAATYGPGPGDNSYLPTSGTSWIQGGHGVRREDGPDAVYQENTGWTQGRIVAPEAIVGGSGGGKGCAGSAHALNGYSQVTGCSGEVAGGAGGSAIVVIAPSITVSGSVLAEGGTGSSSTLGGNCSGGWGSSISNGDGSGGAIWLRATTVSVSGTIDVGNGALRIDAHELNWPGAPSNLIRGSTEGLAPLLELRQNVPGEVTLLNNSLQTYEAVLTVLE